MAKEKRVEILFEPTDYERLADVARQEGRSVGGVIREAVAKYVASPSDKEREAAWDDFFSIETDIDPGSPEDIKNVILKGYDQDDERLHASD